MNGKGMARMVIGHLALVGRDIMMRGTDYLSYNEITTNGGKPLLPHAELSHLGNMFIAAVTGVEPFKPYPIRVNIRWGHDFSSNRKDGEVIVYIKSEAVAKIL